VENHWIPKRRRSVRSAGDVSESVDTENARKRMESHASQTGNLTLSINWMQLAFMGLAVSILV
jgi:hypothetical protein